MTRLAVGLALFCALPCAADDARPLARIAFGCCADQDRPLPIFDKIADLKPDLYLAMGDNIYVDIKREPGLDEMANMKAKYDRLAALPGWQRLKTSCPMLATWDDHDYGKNDIGAEYPHKDESQQLHLDFFGVPRDSPRRTQKGVYNAKVIGPAGKRVQVILLDTRYFRSKLKKDARPLPGTRIVPYLPNTDPDATMLGPEQWKWLEDQLKQPAELRLLVSSIQVVADEHPLREVGQPAARARPPVQAPARHPREWGRRPERRPAPRRNLVGPKGGRLPALRRDVQRAQPGDQGVAGPARAQPAPGRHHAPRRQLRAPDHRLGRRRPAHLGPGARRGRRDRAQGDVPAGPAPAGGRGPRAAAQAGGRDHLPAGRAPAGRPDGRG